MKRKRGDEERKEEGKKKKESWVKKGGKLSTEEREMTEVREKRL